MAPVLINDSLDLGVTLLEKLSNFNNNKINFNKILTDLLTLDSIFWKSKSESFSYKDVGERINYWCSVINKYFINEDKFFVKCEGAESFCQVLALICLGKNIYLDAKKSSFEADYDIANINSSLILENCNKTQVYFKSSGTTSNAKWISHSLNKLLITAYFQNSLFQDNPSESFGLFLPWQHVGGFMLIIRAMIFGKTIFKGHYLDLFSSSEYFDGTSLVPYQLSRLIHNPTSLQSLKNCKAIIIGGDYCSLSLIEQCLKLNLNLYLSYGMTESLGFLILNNCKNNSLKFTPGFKLEISKGGTFRFIDFENNIIDSADIVSIENNIFKVIGRKINTFKLNGEWVSPEEIENIALLDSNIFEAVCIPVDTNQKRGIPILFISTSAKDKNEWATIKNRLNVQFKESSLKYFPSEIIPWPLHIRPPVLKKNMQLREDLKVFYHQKNSSKENILFLPGTFNIIDHSASFRKSFPHFNFYLLPHLPHHNEKNKEWVYSLNKEDILSLYEFILNENFPAPFYLMGYSLGGRITLELYQRASLTLKKIILISTHPGLLDDKEKDLRRKQDQMILNNLKNINTTLSDLKIFFEKWYQNSIFGKFREKDNYQKLIKNLADINPIKDWISYWDRVINIFSLANQSYIIPHSTPLLYLYGSEDLKYTELSKDFLNKSNIKTVKIKESGHAIFYENYLEATKEINKFLNSAI